MRKNTEEELIAIFNFSNEEKDVWIAELNEDYYDLISGDMNKEKRVCLEAFGMRWFAKKTNKNANFLT